MRRVDALYIRVCSRPKVGHLTWVSAEYLRASALSVTRHSLDVCCSWMFGNKKSQLRKLNYTLNIQYVFSTSPSIL